MEHYGIKRFLIILKYNIKLCCGWNVLAGILILLLTPLFFYLKQLTFREMATIGELYLPLIGVFLFTGVMNIDKENHVEAFIAIRSIPLILLFFLKLSILLIINMLLIFPITEYCFYNNGSFPISQCKGGFLISSLFLGILGMTVSHAVGDRKAGYITSIAYFFMEMVSKGSITGKFYLFSTLRESFQEKYNILMFIGIMIGINIVLLQKPGLINIAKRKDWS